jgi:hypothetical protein
MRRWDPPTCCATVNAHHTHARALTTHKHSPPPLPCALLWSRRPQWPCPRHSCCLLRWPPSQRPAPGRLTAWLRCRSATPRRPGRTCRAASCPTFGVSIAARAGGLQQCTCPLHHPARATRHTHTHTHLNRPDGLSRQTGLRHRARVGERDLKERGAAHSMAQLLCASRRVVGRGCGLRGWRTAAAAWHTAHAAAIRCHPAPHRLTNVRAMLLCFASFTASAAPANPPPITSTRAVLLLLLVVAASCAMLRALICWRPVGGDADCVWLWLLVDAVGLSQTVGPRVALPLGWSRSTHAARVLTGVRDKAVRFV